MSLDLDWSLLDDQLSDRFLETINRALDNSSTKRPSFLGDIRFENLRFGSDPPDVVIRSITDIWPDFVSIDDPPVRRRGARQATPASNATTLVESPTETFAPSLHGGGVAGELPLRTYTQFDDAAPPNRIHGPPSVVSASVAGSVPATPAAGLGSGYYQQWSTALASRGIRAAGLGGAGSLPQTQVTSPVDSVPPSPGYFQLWQHQQQHPLSTPAFGPGYLGNTSRQTSFDASSFRGGGPGPQSSVSQVGAKRDANSLHPPFPGYGSSLNGRHAFRSTPAASSCSPSGQLSPGDERDATPSPSSASQLPSLQMRLSLVWPTTTFRLTITTSLLINYPSPAFMSLPLTLSVTGFVMRAGLIVALEGEHQRAHVCLVEEEDDEQDAQQDSNAAPPAAAAVGAAAGVGGKKVDSPGMNILPQVTFESEVGEHDKHVLKNVGKVEKFITEVIRKGLQDELVYPNYYTIDLPSSKGRPT
ncbi:related to mitochondrial inheritance component mdm12 [Sporisorium reilianum SRZ2]|uniref:Mitochondrial distribution and morphology protein 12 n=1 Tax=Sporisorium reilianum (strain SRZ2) TaxID=999809 RepID=E6ZX08_SPORE|nr:related to mitochondrial inheritance component mdm12 [Sporisorium reilianum SRZ2]